MWGVPQGSSRAPEMATRFRTAHVESPLKPPPRPSRIPTCFVIRVTQICGVCRCGRRFEEHGAHATVADPVGLHCGACCPRGDC